MAVPRHLMVSCLLHGVVVLKVRWNFLSEFSCSHADSDIAVIVTPSYLLAPAYSMWLLTHFELYPLQLYSGKQHQSRSRAALLCDLGL